MCYNSPIKERKEVDPMTITITAPTLHALTGRKFSLAACEAICELYESCGGAPYIGDVVCCYCELPAASVEEGDQVVATLSNGNVLIAH